MQTFIVHSMNIVDMYSQSHIFRSSHAFQEICGNRVYAYGVVNYAYYSLYYSFIVCQCPLNQ